MPDERPPPGKVEATALAIAGPAFALSLLFLRQAIAFAPGIFDATAAVLVAVGLAPWAHRLRGAAAGTLVRGLGLALAGPLVAKSLVPPFFSAVLPATVAVVGGAILQANARRKAPSLLVDTLGVTLLAVALGLALLVGGFPEPDRLRLTLVVVAAATGAGLAVRRALLRTSHADLAPMPLGILLVSAIGAIYLSYRGLVRDRVANLPLYEWSLAAAAGLLLLARLRRRAKDREVADAWSAAARRHAQDVRPVYDARMGPLAAVVGRWLEQGVGFDEYRAAMSSHGARVPDGVATLHGGRTRASRREAVAQRLAAHDAALRSIDERGAEHGIAQPSLR